jgi:hypothetical protein
VSNEIYTLAYFSRNRIEESSSNLKAEIAKILSTARTNNSRVGVTGALLYSKGYFAQVLEGPLREVEAIFESIQRDCRHHDVTILHFKPVGERSFSQWSMAFAGLSDLDLQQSNLEAMMKNSADIESGQVGRDMVAVLSNLIGRHEAAHA